MIRRLLSVLCIVTCAAASARADDFAYQATGDRQFGIVNLTTGEFTHRGEIGHLLAGLVVGPDNELYGGFYNDRIVVRVNRDEGFIQYIAPTSIKLFAMGGTSNGNVFALDPSLNLHSLNVTNGQTSLIGPTGLRSQGAWTSLSTGGDSLYLSSGTILYSVSTTTGAATIAGVTGRQLGAMVQVGGTLYGGQVTPSLAVTTIDPQTGHAPGGPALTGEFADTFWGLAPLPEPSLVAIGFGLAAVFLRRDRARRARGA